MSKQHANPRWLILIALVALRASGQEARTAPLYAYHLPAPRVLWIAPTPSLSASYLAAACRWDLTVCQTRTEMDVCYHAIDKAVEYTPEMEAALQKRLSQNLMDRLAELDTYQMVVLEGELSGLTAEQQARLKDWVARGGLLVLGTGWVASPEEKTASENPLMELMPCRSKEGQGPWFIFFGRPVRDPAVAGVPTHRLHVRNWLPQVVGKPGSTRLTEPRDLGPGYSDTGFTWWVRSHGQGHVVFNPAGISMGAAFQTNFLPSYWTARNGPFFFNPAYDSISRYQDEGALLADLWRQLSYWYIYGRRAFPALIYLRTPDEALPAGAEVRIQAYLDLTELENSATLVVQWVTPRNETIAEWKQPASGGVREVEPSLAIPEEYPWPLMQVQAALVDPSSGAILHRASDFVEVAPVCSLEATLDRFNYQPGETVRVEAQVTARRTLPKATVRLVLHDFRGRVFADLATPVSWTPATGSEQPQSHPEKPAYGQCWFNWVFPLVGSGVDQYLFTGDLMLCSGSRVWARGSVSIYDGRPWDMRREFVYSPWDFLLHFPDPVVKRGLDLERDAGYNGISGHDMGDQVVAWAERQGWRMYAEGLPGPNVWNPLIDTAGSAALEAKFRQELAPWVQQNQPNPFRSSAIALVSLGEEPGFKNGWGTRYYWDAPQAPPEAAAVFQGYLKQLYHDDLGALNQEWGTSYVAWEQVPLTKEYSQGLTEAVMKQWEAEQGKATGDFLFHLAPYLETFRFYDRYFDEINQAAVKVVREALQPSWKTMFTAGLFQVETDVPAYGELGPFYPKEAALYGHANWVAEHGDVPGFTASMWDFFDHLPLLSAELWSALAVGNTYFDSWVDFGLCFNKDFTHTRSSFFKKRWLTALRPIRKLLLDKRFYTDPAIGFYRGGEGPVPATPWNPSSAWDAPTQQYSALLESGFRPTLVKPPQFGRCKVLFAPVSEVVTPEAAEGFRDFVKNGGTLIATMFFAAFSPHGNPLAEAPALGLHDLLGFRVDGRRRVNQAESFTIPPGAEPLPAHTVILAQRHDILTDLSPETQVLARFADGTPAILVHPYGQGRVYYFNFHYDWTHWWNTFYTPDREAYRVLLEKILLSVPGVSRPYFVRCQGGRPSNTSGWWKVDFDPEAVGRSNPYWAEELYTDPSGQARYLFLFADHRSPVIDARIEWFRAGDTAYDVLNHQRLRWEKAPDGTAFIPLTLPAGGGAILAFLPSTAVKVAVKPTQPSFRAGSVLNVHVAVQEGRPGAATAHSMALQVEGPDGRPLAGLAREITVAGQTTVPLLTALNDPPGKWRITVSDCVTGLQGHAEVRCRGNGHRSVPLACLESWPSECWPVPDVTAERFLASLKRLTQTYLTCPDRSKLGYYYFIPGETDSRHHLMAPLSQIDWRPYTRALVDFLRQGHSLILTGEDFGLDPLSGLAVSPFGDSHALEAVATVLARADRVVQPRTLPTVLVALFGSGRLVLDRTSIDAQGWTNEQIQPWHQGWINALKQKVLSGEPEGAQRQALTPASLRQWLLSDRKVRYWFPTP